MDFLTPVCKAFATESGVEAAQLAIQIHGGYGYLKEYRVEQILRDVRITPIYEGTNGIQAITLADRVLRMKGGAPAAAFRAEIAEALAATAPATQAALRDAFGHWEHATEALLKRPGAGVAATSYLRLTGLVAVGAMWARLEAAAESSPNPQRTLAVARFFRDWLLPECGHLAGLVERGVDLASVPAQAFEAN